MDNAADRSLADRLDLFDVTDRDIATLQAQRERVLASIPALMMRFDAVSSANQWGELSKPIFWRLREDYWQRMATGLLDRDFVTAAQLFARTTHELGIPSDSFTSRNSSAARMLIEWMFRGGIVYRIVTAKRRYDYANALQKSLWFGLSIVLEAYDAAERARQQATLVTIEASFATKIADVAGILGSQVVKLEQAVALISGFADRSTQSADLIAEDARNASLAVSRIAKSAGDLARSVGDIGHRTSDCAQSAREAAEQARLGEAEVANFLVISRVITEITAFINQVADRTKLLALNATIEAARAGPAGRGFAVVAEEVRNLARETSVATARVTQQVNLIQGSTEETAAAIHALTRSIEQVSANTALIAESLREQDAATRAIALSVQQAAVGNEQVSELTGIMKTETDQSLELAGSLSNAAAGIGLQSATVQAITRDFMAEIRAVQQAR
jgi:methyl-accepting chemotaxis protein